MLVLAVAGLFAAGLQTYYSKKQTDLQRREQAAALERERLAQVPLPPQAAEPDRPKARGSGDVAPAEGSERRIAIPTDAEIARYGAVRFPTSSTWERIANISARYMLYAIGFTELVHFILGGRKD